MRPSRSYVTAGRLSSVRVSAFRRSRTARTEVGYYERLERMTSDAERDRDGRRP
jgi:hypothetical protein